MRHTGITAAIALVLTATAAVGAPAVPATPAGEGGRIVGGTRVPDGAAPWAAEIYLASDFSDQRGADRREAKHHDPRALFMAQRPDWDLRHLCGGALIAPGWVVTAAHCVTQLSSPNASQRKLVRDFLHYTRLRIGSQDISSKTASSCKPIDVKLADDGDIALIRIDPSACSPKPGAVTPIRILETAPTDQHRAAFVPATQLNVYGWGMIRARAADAIGVSTVHARKHYDIRHLDPNSPDLLSATINFVPPAICEARPDYREAVREGMICAGLASGAKDQCDGDSGGPLTLDVAIDDTTVEHLLVGLVHGGDGCAQKKTPGLYVYVPQYLVWIESTIGGGDVTAGRAMLMPPRASGGT